MTDQSTECCSEQNLQLQGLQQEMMRQRHELEEVASKLTEQQRALQALRMQLAVIMGSWRGDIRRDLGGLIRAIDSANEAEQQREQFRAP